MAVGENRILDEFLVIAAQGGDAGAFNLLAHRWQRKLLAHAWRMTGNMEQAHDAAQTGWLEIAAGLRRLTDETAFPAWAYRIVSRACTRQIARAIRHRHLSEQLACEELVEMQGAPVDPDLHLDVARVMGLIQRLPPDQHSAIALFYLEEMSVAEVAVALDIPVGTVKTRLLHARRRLRSFFEEKDHA